MNKKLICTAVGGALAFGAGSAQAFLIPNLEALVPYVVKDTNRTTVVTVIMGNTYDGEFIDNHGTLHLQYWTKSTTDANTAACSPSSVEVPVTPNDIVTFDTAGILGYPLFGDTTNPAPLGVGISYAAPRHGYLVVQSPLAKTLLPQQEAPYDGLPLLQSYWLEVDLANGGAHGDQALMNYYWLAGWYDAGSFSMSLWPGYELGTAVNFWPTSVASTAFTVTPLGTDMVTRENNQSTLQVFNNAAPDIGVQGAYDRNENGVDGTVPVTVRCVGRVTPAQLMPGVVANAAWATQGGWGALINLGISGKCLDWDDTDACPTTGPYGSATVYQVDTSSAGGKFISNATNISFWRE